MFLERDDLREVQRDLEEYFALKRREAKPPKTVRKSPPRRPCHPKKVRGAVCACGTMRPLAETAPRSVAGGGLTHDGSLRAAAHFRWRFHTTSSSRLRSSTCSWRTA